METGNDSSGLKEIQVLVINLGGVRLGVDTEFIKEIRAPADVKSEHIEIFSIYAKIDFHDREAPLTCPKVLLFNPSRERTAGLLVEAPEDLLSIRTELISIMPPLVQKNSTPPAIWGAVNRGEDIILLIDLSKIKF